MSLYDAKSYQKIEVSAQRYAQKSYAATLGQRSLSFRYGNCTLLGEKGFKSRRPLRSIEDWGEICKLIVGYWTSNAGRSLRLEIWREYTSFQRRAAKEASLTKAKRAEIHKLTKRTSEKTLTRQYIPHTDLENVIPKQMITEIINEDPYKSMDEAQKAAFTQRVQSEGRILLTMFIYSGLRMECLKKLLDKGYSDADLPLTTNARCHSHDRCVRKFDELLGKQGAYLAARFDKPGGHQNFDHHIVVPIHFCPKDEERAEMVSEMDTGSGAVQQNAYGTKATAKDRALCGSGAYSSVYRVRLDPSHHALTPVSRFGHSILYAH